MDIAAGWFSAITGHRHAFGLSQPSTFSPSKPTWFESYLRFAIRHQFHQRREI